MSLDQCISMGERIWAQLLTIWTTLYIDKNIAQDVSSAGCNRGTELGACSARARLNSGLQNAAKPNWQAMSPYKRYSGQSARTQFETVCTQLIIWQSGKHAQLVLAQPIVLFADCGLLFAL